MSTPVEIEILTADGKRWDSISKWRSLSYFESHLRGQPFSLMVNPPGGKDSGWRIRVSQIVAYRVSA